MPYMNSWLKNAPKLVSLIIFIESSTFEGTVLIELSMLALDSNMRVHLFNVLLLNGTQSLFGKVLPEENKCCRL